MQRILFLALAMCALVAGTLAQRGPPPCSCESRPPPPHPPPPSPPPPPPSGSCAGINAWVNNIAYTGGDEVVYGGSLWTAKWWSYADVPGGAAGVWVNDRPCSGPMPSPVPVWGNCAGANAWVRDVAYVGGNEVVYGGRLWTAKWWTYADIPGGAAGVWVDDGSCTDAALASRFFKL